MSRIGKQPIVVPDKVKVEFQGKAVSVEGQLGKLSYPLPEGIQAAVKDGKIILSRSDEISNPALYGTSRARIANMVQGVCSGFSKVLEIHGVGFKGQVAGQKLSLQLGFSHPVSVDIPEGIKMSFDARQPVLTISGIDKEVVGDVAAQIRRMKPPEPYKGTGIRYRGEHIMRKAGKTAAGATGGAGAKK